ncbi:MAG: hypothetical protein IKT39_02410 [Clostridia bacterium]|nr:hypothetical protein [Clostridia bacterium]
MSTTFEDNAVVTAEDLNNIAVDLGDATFSVFSDEKFGVDKLNEITAGLVGKGILTTGDRCEPIVSDGKVYIKSGVIVFGSGAKIRISEPVGVSLVNGGYIYAFNDVTTGKASIKVGECLPTSGDYVLIAQIDDAGIVVDLREKAVANLTLPTELQNNYAEQTANIYCYNENGDNDVVVDFVVMPDIQQCKYIYLKRFGGYSPSVLNPSVLFYTVELSEEYQTIFYHRYSGATTLLEVKKIGGMLYFKATRGASIPYSGEATFVLM